jgi:hypothetical protein
LGTAGPLKCLTAEREDASCEVEEAWAQPGLSSASQRSEKMPRVRWKRLGHQPGLSSASQRSEKMPRVRGKSPQVLRLRPFVLPIAAV